MKQAQVLYQNRIQNESSLLTFDVLADLHITLPWRNLHLETALEDIWQRDVNMSPSSVILQITVMLFSGKMSFHSYRNFLFNMRLLWVIMIFTIYNTAVFIFILYIVL